MRITVSLDTQAVITQPSPAKVKGGASVPLEVVFTRSSQAVTLPEGASLAFVLKPKNQLTGGTLVLHADFSLAPGNIYTGTANFFTQPLMAVLGLSDDATANDMPQLEAVAELEWTIAAQRFVSATFPIIVESPLRRGDDDTPAALPDLKATQSEAEAGLDNAKWMTPLRTAEAIAALAQGGGGFIVKQASFQAEPGKAYLVGVSPDGGGGYGSGDEASGGSVGSVETEIIITLPASPDAGDVCVFAPNRFMWEDFTQGGERRAREGIPVKVVAPEGAFINGFESELSLGSEMQIVWSGGSTGWLVVDRALCRFRGTNDNGSTQYFDQGDQHEISFRTDYDPLNGFSPDGMTYTIPAAGVWQFNVMAFMWSPPGAVFELTMVNNWQQIGRFHATNIGDACQALYATGVYCSKGDTIRVLGRVWGANGHIAGDGGVGFFEGHLT